MDIQNLLLNQEKQWMVRETVTFDILKIGILTRTYLRRIKYNILEPYIRIIYQLEHVK